MRDSSTSWYPDDHQASGASGRSHKASRGNAPLRLLRSLVGIGGPRRGSRPERTSGEVTTQLQTGRGQALRDAHRTLRQHMKRHPALKKVTPHLWALERALSKHGSRALAKLPLPLLQSGLAQLALLQRDDESAEDAAQLRVLRLRVIEAISRRGQAPGAAAHGWDPALPHPLRGAGLEVRHVSADEYERAVKHGAAPRLSRLNGQSPH